MNQKTKRCKLIVGGVRCDLDATHRLIDGTGSHVKERTYCEEHARLCVTTHNYGKGFTWTAEPLEDYDYDPDDDMTCELALLLIERDKHIKELEAACRAALAWYGPDGDHIHEPVRGQLRRALGLTEEMTEGVPMTENAQQFERIYLTDADYYDEGDGPVLWCYERIRDDDIEYVNVAAFDAQAVHIADLEDALRFYADCEWGWNGAGDYEPMIFELPERLPAAFNCKDAGSVARAALKEAIDERPE